MIYSLTASSRHLCCILQPSCSSSSKKKHPGTEKMQGFIHKKLAKFEKTAESKTNQRQRKHLVTSETATALLQSAQRKSLSCPFCSLFPDKLLGVRKALHLKMDGWMHPLLTAFLKNACQVRTEGQHREKRWLFKLHQLRADSLSRDTTVCVRLCLTEVKAAAAAALVSSVRFLLGVFF